MLRWLKSLRQRLYRVEETAIRVTEMQTEMLHLRREVSESRAFSESVMALMQRLTEISAEQHSLMAETRGIAHTAQVLAGEGLTELKTRSRVQMMEIREMQARMMAHLLAVSGERDWSANRFRVYSQFGEDGLIQLLLREIPIEDRTFIEFGVEDYAQATTRYLLVNDRWRGLVMDGSPENIAALQAEPISQWYDLSSVAAFITRENIDEILRAQGFTGPIGLLCVDIDGNDYWVWEALTVVDPVLVIVEYNYRFGPDLSVVVPYDPAFIKTEAHPSGVYYGASLSALCHLANRKGYAFVGCSEGGVNAFFVRRDRLPVALPERTPSEGYVTGQHAEMRTPDGRIVKASLEEQQNLLLQLPLVTVG
jgi:hypothetical protein